MPRYCFSEFVLSPRQRVLLRNGREQPLIPRYFDLLVFLVERRHEAVHRRDIFDRVWTDVTVSDSALSQAIRTIRRVLDDDSREPRFIATVSRHGYRFIFADVREEEDSAEPHPAAPVSALPEQASGQPLWAAAAGRAAFAGAAAGMLGGGLLALMPGGASSFTVVPALGLVGACCGGLGGAGVGAGLSAALVPARSPGVLALVLGGAAGGGAVGTSAQWLARWSLTALVGVHLDVGGGVEGVVIGAAAGLGYGLATLRPSGRTRVLMLTAAACGLAALLLTSLGRPLVGGTIHQIASGSAGSHAALTPLGRLIGEPTFGPVSGAILGTTEGLLFGLGLALGLSRQHSPD